MTSSKTHSILSIDFGERYLGFAIKLKDESTIFPLDVLDTTEHELFDYLKKYLHAIDLHKLIGHFHHVLLLIGQKNYC